MLSFSAAPRSQALIPKIMFFPLPPFEFELLPSHGFAAYPTPFFFSFIRRQHHTYPLLYASSPYRIFHFIGLPLSGPDRTTWARCRQYDPLSYARNFDFGTALAGGYSFASRFVLAASARPQQQ
jgi:hypothetical protein